MDETEEVTQSPTGRGGSTSPQLVVAWCMFDPSRVGELWHASGNTTLGRGRAGWVQRRPGGDLSRPGIDDPRISREQLRVSRDRGGLTLTVTGKGPVLVDGALHDTGATVRVTPGSTINVRQRLLLLVTEATPLPSVDGGLHPFGEPDRTGIVGESAHAWKLRRDIGLLAGRERHVLVLGESGVGKELVARALHGRSPRHGGPWVARNAATFPESLIDAELFGNVRNYPNPGMADRPGLIGEAHGGTLFLDEIGELPSALQAHLLRVLDAGEYQRLGDSRVRRSDLRLVAATNRSVEQLKHDLAARLPLRIEVPPLRDRRSDVPILLRALVRRLASDDPLLSRSVLDDQGEPRVECRWVERLLHHSLPTNVRGLEAAFWAAVTARRADEPLDGPLGDEPSAAPAELPPSRDPSEISPDEIRAALDTHGGSREATWRALGLRSRYQLRRLMQQHDIDWPSGAR